MWIKNSIPADWCHHRHLFCSCNIKLQPSWIAFLKSCVLPKSQNAETSYHIENSKNRSCLHNNLGSGVQSPKIAAGSLLHDVLYFWDWIRCSKSKNCCWFLTSWGSLLLRPLPVPYFMRFFTSETTASSLLHEVLYFWDHCQLLTSWGSLLLRPLTVPYFMRFFPSETTDGSVSPPFFHVFNPAGWGGIYIGW